MMKHFSMVAVAFSLVACGDNLSKEYETSQPAGTLTASEYYGAYSIVDENFGTNVNVMLTETERVMFTNSLPPWPAKDFPVGNNTDVSEQSRTYKFPLQPVYTGNATRERSTGVSTFGIKFDAGTAQRARCENNVQYNVEAVQDLIPFGVDAHNAHVQNDGTYHYHNVPVSEINGTDPQHVGFALDGFYMYYSPTNQYPSSYRLKTEKRAGVNCTYSEPDFAEITFDNIPDGTFQQDYEYVEGGGVLDECNGAFIDGTYAYFLTDAYPHIPRCLKGELNGGKNNGAGASYDTQRGGGQQGPDFTEAANALGITVEELKAALGGPPPNFEAAAKTLGITVEELTAVLPAPPQR